MNTLEANSSIRPAYPSTFDEKNSQRTQTYYMTKIAAAALMTVGAVFSFTGAYYGWPLVCSGIDATFIRIGVADGELLAEVAAKAIIGLTKKCIDFGMPGGKVTLAVLLLGASILFAPFACILAVPLLPGALLVKKGAELWS